MTMKFLTTGLITGLMAVCVGLAACANFQSNTTRQYVAKATYEEDHVSGEVSVTLTPYTPPAAGGFPIAEINEKIIDALVQEAISKYRQKLNQDPPVVQTTALK